jgi:hypothetical protein
MKSSNKKLKKIQQLAELKSMIMKSTYSMKFPQAFTEP